jgi:pimeloyl-ACP methyl ester carboxylesterase
VMAYTRTPRPLQVVLRALDDTFGAAAGALYVGTFRQVRHYLRDKELKQRVDAIVDAALTPDVRILVGHSLGSVVALEFVRRHPEHQLDLLLTVGSPLGLSMIQNRSPVSSFGSTHPGGIPASVATWVNVRDPRDPVACAGDLHRGWPGILDRKVDNQGDAHNIARYLSKVESGSAIWAALPPRPGGEAPGLPGKDGRDG